MVLPAGVSALRHDPVFRRYLAVRGQSALGTAVSAVVVPLLAAVVLGATTSQLGVLLVVTYSVRPAARLLAAVAAERSTRRVTMLRLLELGRFASVGLVPVVWWTGHLTMWSLVALTAVTSALTGCFTAYAVPVVVDLVDRDSLARANGLIGTVTSATQVAGPGLAGLLLQVLTAPVVLLVDAATYLASALLLRGREPVRPLVEGDADAGFIGVARGFLVVLHKPLAPIAVGALLVTALNGVVGAVLPIFATRDLGLAPGTYAWLLAAGAAGGIAGGAAVGVLARRMPTTHVALLALLLMAASLWALPLSRPGWSAVLGLAWYEGIGSFAGVLYIAALMTAIPAVVPIHTIARASAAAMLIPELGMALGAALSALVGDLVEPRHLLVLAASTSLLVCLSICGHRVTSRRGRSTPA
ncbi:MFS transporter [Amycolatopsis sp. QT-25]|uniref:MFS transporter n=1 Tax=Amycolatopsis sp. QT-25 TaxID=3034022 RepID=UPI0023ED79B3|nr:MFS transporter [Amycolatopsis sp. QT-25]WET76223.1 MFS transporter [Amycolatopsis sp. QT-25]